MLRVQSGHFTLSAASNKKPGTKPGKNIHELLVWNYVLGEGSGLSSNSFAVAFMKPCFA